MPNHIKNRLTITGLLEDVAAFFDAVSGDEGRAMDFAKIIPPPANLFTGDLGEKEKQQCKKEGRPNWYDWNIENWGTKWNAYEGDIEGNVMTFETAWSHPEPIVEQIAKMFPKIQIIWEYADEDTSSNTGSYIIKSGKTFYHEIENGSSEAYEMYFNLHPDRREDYELVDGQYKYKDEN